MAPIPILYRYSPVVIRRRLLATALLARHGILWWSDFGDG
jgi:hypothetical protein